MPDNPKGFEAFEGRVLGRWAYPKLTDIEVGPPEAVPPPPLHVLKALFDWAYLSLPAHVWTLPLPQQSDEVLRTVAKLARGLTPGCRAFRSMAREPDKHGGEYLVLKALMDVDVEAWLEALHADHPTDVFVAQRLDPDGRWPPGAAAGHS